MDQQTFVEQLKEFELPNVEFTGEKLRGGSGSYGYVEVVLVAGTRCAAKFSHQVFEEYQWKKSPVDYFRKECTLMSQLRHPHIVQFLGVCYHQEALLPALVMELLMTCLHDYLETAEALPMAIKHNILLGLSKGLVYLHSMDIVHRDLTARNVLLSDSLTPKIADLGMARLQTGREAATMTKGPGNANYMPPEAKDIDITRYGKPIDCFSIGHLILFTITQVFPNMLGSTYFNEATGFLVARTEMERREQSFKIINEIFDLDHPLVLLACDCLAVKPSLRPTAPQIMQKLQTMSIIPYRTWNLSKHEMIQVVIKHEDAISKLQQSLSSKQSVIEPNIAAQEEPVLRELHQQTQADDRALEGAYVNLPQSPTTLQWSSDDSEDDYVNDMKKPSPGCKQNTPKQHAKTFFPLLQADDRALEGAYVNLPQSPTTLQWSSDDSEDDYVNQPLSPGCEQDTRKQLGYVNVQSSPKLNVVYDEVPPKFQESQKTKKPLASPRHTPTYPVAFAPTTSLTKSPIVSRLYRKQVSSSPNNQSMIRIRRIESLQLKRQSSLSSIVNFPNSPILFPRKTTFQYTEYRSRVSAMTGVESPKNPRNKFMLSTEPLQNGEPGSRTEVVAELMPVTNKESRSFERERFRTRSLSAEAVLGSWKCRHCGKLRFVSGRVCDVCSAQKVT